MKIKQATEYLSKNYWQAVLLIFFITFIPIINLVGVLFAVLLTLQRGARIGAIGMLAATLPYALYFMGDNGSHVSYGLMIRFILLGMVVLINGLSWLLAVMLRQRMPLSFILQAIALSGVLVISIVYLLYPNVADWWTTQMQDYLLQTSKIVHYLLSDQSTQQVQPSSSSLTSALTTSPIYSERMSSITRKTADSTVMNVALNQTIIPMIKAYLMGLMVTIVFLVSLLYLIVAYKWQLWAFNIQSIRNEFHYIRLNYLAGLLFMIGIILSYLQNEVVLDMMPIAYLLFGIAGLSVLHYWFHQIRVLSIKWIGIILTYLAIFKLFPFSIIVFSFIAWLDIFLDIRRRFQVL